MTQPKKDKFAEGFCLVLMIWGDLYTEEHVNQLARSVKKHSKLCKKIVLITDRPRANIDSDIVQSPIPAFFRKERFFGGGYPVKISAFGAREIPDNMRCVFLDLDTIILGDLNQIAQTITSAKQIAMLFPNRFRWLILKMLYALSAGRIYPCGNSSIVAFASNAGKEIVQNFERFHREKTHLDQDFMWNDDRFISWFSRRDMHYMPARLAVSFRKEFLARSLIYLWLRARVLTLTARRGQIAVTFNGSVKPKCLAQIGKGEAIVDKKGRFGKWSQSFIGPGFNDIKTAVQDYK